MIQYTYGWEKLYDAVRILAGPGAQKERLLNAVIYSVSSIDPENDLPDDIREDFREFMRGITSVAASGDEGRVQATVDSLDAVGVSQAIEEIISFYDSVCHHSAS